MFIIAQDWKSGDYAQQGYAYEIVWIRLTFESKNGKIVDLDLIDWEESRSLWTWKSHSIELEMSKKNSILFKGGYESGAHSEARDSGSVVQTQDLVHFR